MLQSVSRRCDSYAPPLSPCDVRHQALASPHFKGGIKFSLAKKPPSMFDVPKHRVCPGPGAYDQGLDNKMLGVAAYRSAHTCRAAASSTHTPQTHAVTFSLPL